MSGERETPLALAGKAAEALRERGIDNARLEAELLLAGVLGIRRLDLYLQHDRPITDEELERYREFVKRRRRREPLQYIVGEVQFRDLHLSVDPRVLIPRPETEVLVGEVLRWAWRRCGVQPPRAGRRRATLDDGPGAEAEQIRELHALDVGTGSGAIALSLAAEGPFLHVVATDSSSDALTVAAHNAQRTGVQDYVELRHGELWEPLAEGERFDVIVSNPPYIAEQDREMLAPEVREWEPAQALYAGNGFALLDPLIEGAAARLQPAGLLAVEVGLGQAEQVAERLQGSGKYEDVRVVQDLTSRERVVLASAAGVD